MDTRRLSEIISEALTNQLEKEGKTISQIPESEIEVIIKRLVDKICKRTPVS